MKDSLYKKKNSWQKLIQNKKQNYYMLTLKEQLINDINKLPNNTLQAISVIVREIRPVRKPHFVHFFMQRKNRLRVIFPLHKKLQKAGFRTALLYYQTLKQKKYLTLFLVQVKVKCGFQMIFTPRLMN